MAELIRGSLVVALSGSPGGFGYGVYPQVGGVTNYDWGTSLDLNAAGTVMVVGDTNNDEVHTYDLIADVWVERAGSPMAAGSFKDYGSGVALSADGSILIVGEPHLDGAGSLRGAIHTYDYNGGTGAWDFRNTLSGTVNSERLGRYLSMNAAGTRFVTGRTSPTRITAYDWSGSAWIEDTSAQLGTPTGTVITYTDNWGANFRVTPDGTRMVAAYSGTTTGDQGSAVGVWEWSGSAWSRKGGEMFSALGDNDEEQATNVAITDDGQRVYIYWYGLYYTNTARVAVYDWVDPNWVFNATESAKFGDGVDPWLSSWADTFDSAGMWVSADESVVAIVGTYEGSRPNVLFFGDIPGATTPCITKTVDTTNGPVVIDTYCVDSITPSNWEDDPVNVPRPPVTEGVTTGQNEQTNVNCVDKGFYKVYSDVGPAVNENAAYEQWLAENFWSVDFNDGVCN